MQEWIGSFDPEAFSIDAVNQRLRKIFRASGKRKPMHIVQRKSVTPSIQDLHALLHTSEARLEQPQVRQRIRPAEKVPLELNDRERELILEQTFADEELTSHLRVVPHFSLYPGRLGRTRRIRRCRGQPRWIASPGA